ncbi:MAG TPA: hypothetical protein PKC69_07920 [Chitinophagaceae bacterium]|nr:hypothetical protein [Chitinophagaceae bacterium]
MKKHLLLLCFCTAGYSGWSYADVNAPNARAGNRTYTDPKIAELEKRLNDLAAENAALKNR